MLRYLLRPPEKEAGVIFTSWLIFFSGSPFTMELQFVAVWDKRRLQTWRLAGNKVNIVVKCFNRFPIPRLDFKKTWS